MSDTKFKPIEEITEAELQGLWPLIGGSPHLFEQGKDELKEGLSKGFFESLQVDYYTMAAIVDYLRSKGYDAGTPALHPSESAGVNLPHLKVKSKADGKIYLVKKYIHVAGGEQNIWCDDWHGHHVIGRDCEWVQSTGSAKEEAVALMFAEWVQENAVAQYENKKLHSWRLFGPYTDNIEYTTSQLYNIYKKSK